MDIHFALAPLYGKGCDVGFTVVTCGHKLVECVCYDRDIVWLRHWRNPSGIVFGMRSVLAHVRLPSYVFLEGQFMVSIFE